MKRVVQIMRKRWRAKMPKFFRWLTGISASMSAVALAIQLALNSSSAIAPDWWVATYPYIIGLGAGMTAASKFTSDHSQDQQ